MKSKIILPDKERLPEDYFKFFKKDDIIARYHNALVAAEKELQEKREKTTYKCKHSGHVFRLNKDGTFNAWFTSTQEAQPWPIYKKCIGGYFNRAYFPTEQEAIEFNKKKFNW